MKRDLTLYKFLDIYMLLQSFNESISEQLLLRSAELGVSDICSCVVKWTCDLFDIAAHPLKTLSEKQLENDSIILDRVIAPSEKKFYYYSTQNIKERFFSENRVLLFKEETDNATT